MKRQFTVGLTSSDIDVLIRGIEEYQKWLEDRTKLLLQRLADQGYQIASAGFQQAQYDGTNDSAVSIEERGEYTKAIVALGNSVLFIEFGTGVTYPDDHPERPAEVGGRGTYGYRFGSSPNGWRYPESNGAGSTATPDPNHPGYLHTFGNPANKPMYEAAKRLREELPKMVREVFGSD